MGGMDLNKALGFLRDHHHAVLLTRHRDGRPQMSPVTAGVQGDHVVISTRETAAKVRNALRDPPTCRCASSPTASSASGSRSTAPPRSSTCPRRWSG
ncbi:pyridoxamine 5'-phosphate oxidase family protein [Nonomuraea salmonea]|uniref:pyridoxamine 5'-phosphate oxidase family protein n=1 Tax=Nonomuraea salmonea TaxID=46181 RepID=UPI0031E989CB